MPTIRIPRLEKQLERMMSTARDPDVVDLTVTELWKIIEKQEQEIQKLRRRK